MGDCHDHPRAFDRDLSAILAGTALGLHIQPMFYFVAVPVIVLVGSIPISPQGAGVMEAMAYILTRSQGATVNEAVALTMSIRVVQILWNLTGGTFVLRGGFHAQRNRSSTNWSRRIASLPPLFEYAPQGGPHPHPRAAASGGCEILSRRAGPEDDPGGFAPRDACAPDDSTEVVLHADPDLPAEGVYFLVDNVRDMYRKRAELRLNFTPPCAGGPWLHGGGERSVWDDSPASGSLDGSIDGIVYKCRRRQAQRIALCRGRSESCSQA